MLEGAPFRAYGSRIVARQLAIRWGTLAALGEVHLRQRNRKVQILTARVIGGACVHELPKLLEEVHVVRAKLFSHQVQQVPFTDGVLGEELEELDEL